MLNTASEIFVRSFDGVLWILDWSKKPSTRTKVWWIAGLAQTMSKAWCVCMLAPEAYAFIAKARSESPVMKVITYHRLENAFHLTHNSIMRVIAAEVYVFTSLSLRTHSDTEFRLQGAVKKNR
jgi:hypothetical protein